MIGIFFMLAFVSMKAFVGLKNVQVLEYDGLLSTHHIECILWWSEKKDNLLYRQRSVVESSTDDTYKIKNVGYNFDQKDPSLTFMKISQHRLNGFHDS